MVFCTSVQVIASEPNPGPVEESVPLEQNNTESHKSEVTVAQVSVDDLATQAVEETRVREEKGEPEKSNEIPLPTEELACSVDVPTMIIRVTNLTNEKTRCSACPTKCEACPTENCNSFCQAPGHYTTVKDTDPKDVNSVPVNEIVLQQEIVSEYFKPVSPNWASLQQALGDFSIQHTKQKHLPPLPKSPRKLRMFRF